MKYWIQAARLYVIGGSILPVVFGTLLAFYEHGIFKPVEFLGALMGVMLIHTAANLLNDYYDYISGADLNNPEAVYPFSGGSRVLIEQKLTAEAVYRAAVILLVVASLIGIVLTVRCGIWVLFLGAFGIVTSIYYVHPLFHLLNLGLGELVVGLNFGVLTVSGAYYVQTGFFSLSRTVASIPVALMIMLVLFINEFPDYLGDLLASKKTLVVRIGRRRAAGLFTALLGITVLSLLVIPLLGFINIWALTGLLALPFIVFAAVCALKHFDNPSGIVPANISIIKSHLFVNLYLSLSCLQTESYKLISFILLGVVFLYQLMTMGKYRVFSAQ